MELQEIKVGIADMNVTVSPNKLITVGLGSCVGIALYDKMSGVGGLAHIMLPDSSQFSNVTNSAKFADLAIPILIKKIEGIGGRQRNLKAKIAGGASMFNFSDKAMVMDIGNRNGIAVRDALKKYSIPLIAEEIGGNKGRTMIFDTASGIVQIRIAGLGVKEI